MGLSRRIRRKGVLRWKYDIPKCGHGFLKGEVQIIIVTTVMCWILVGSEVAVLSSDNFWVTSMGISEWLWDQWSISWICWAWLRELRPWKLHVHQKLPEPVALGLFFLQIPRIKFTSHRGWVSKRSILFYGAGGRAELQGSRGSCGSGIPLSLKALAFVSFYIHGNGKKELAWACQSVFLPRCWGSSQFQPHPPYGFPGKGYSLRRKELWKSHISFLDVQPLAWQTKRDLWLRLLPLVKDKSTYRSRDIPSF